MEQAIFEQLKAILAPYAPYLVVYKDSDQAFAMNCPKEVKKGMPMFFGAAEIRKAYVSFYLMPIYNNPALLEGISPELKKRMQGKSCFNFKKADEALFAELNILTEKGFEWFCQEGWISARP
jgi:hypothetical protein